MDESIRITDRFLALRASPGVGVLYSACPAALSGGKAGGIFSTLARANGAKVSTE